MNKEVALEWAGELKSGKYKQTKECLQDENGYCCLGVLCRLPRFRKKVDEGLEGMLHGTIMDDQPAIRAHAEFIGNGMVLGHYIPKEIREKYGLGAHNHYSMVTLNDNFGLTFEEIGTIVEQAWEHIK